LTEAAKLLESVVLPSNLDDVMAEIFRLRLPRHIALATYLKNTYGEFMRNMTDSDWIEEAEELLAVLAGAGAGREEE
jgi:hypothetical protein